jgi:hypothetical protein
MKANDTDFKVGEYVRMRERPLTCGVIEQIGGTLLTVKLPGTAHASVAAPKWKWERDTRKKYA